MVQRDEFAERLRITWQQLCHRLALGEEPRATAYLLLCRCYGQPGRFYHTLEHLADVFAVLAGVNLPEAQHPALHLAVWYHDTVYDPRAADNEERSADLARAQLATLGLPTDLVEETARLILLTKRHVTTETDRIGLLLLDADLAILGAEPQAYDRYATAIRNEYAHVAADAYRRGRADVLQALFARPRIYGTDVLHETREKQARLNLNRELAKLLSGTSDGPA